MGTVRRKSRRRIAPTPDILETYWSGSLPPDRPATPEEHDLVIGAKFFSWCDGSRPSSVTWRFHPHQAAWSAWIRPARPASRPGTTAAIENAPAE